MTRQTRDCGARPECANECHWFQYTGTECGHPRSLLIIRAIETCPAVPSQWDAWTSNRIYLYLRYRSAFGSVWASPTKEHLDERGEYQELFRWHNTDVSRHDGSIMFEEFVDRCSVIGLQYSADIDYTAYREPYDDEPYQGTDTIFDVIRKGLKLNE